MRGRLPCQGARTSLARAEVKTYSHFRNYMTQAPLSEGLEEIKKGARIGEIGKSRSGAVAPQLFQAHGSRRNRHADGTGASRRLDVARRVPDDHDILGAKRARRLECAPANGLPDQRRPVLAVRTEAPCTEVAVEICALQLEPRAALQVAGGQTEHEVREGGERLQETRDSGHHAVACRGAHLVLERLEVGLG